MPLSARSKYVAGAVVLVVAVVGFKAVTGIVVRSAGDRMIEKTVERSTGKNADVKTNADGTMNIRTDEGTMSTGHEVPSDWPKDIPVYPGATVQYSASVNPADGNQGGALMLLSTDTDTAVSDYYAKELKAQGWTLAATMHAAGTVIMSATKDGRSLSVTVTGQDGQTSITIGIQQKS